MKSHDIWPVDPRAPRVPMLSADTLQRMDLDLRHARFFGNDSTLVQLRTTELVQLLARERGS